MQGIVPESIRRVMLIRPIFKQAAGNDHGLNLGGALENVENSCVAEDAADGVLEREAVAAVDL